MASIVCNNPEQLIVILFGQRLEFSYYEGAVKCVSSLKPFPDIVEDPQNWINAVGAAATWFAAASPRSTLDLNPVFDQHIRLSESPPGTLSCRALHNGVPQGTDKAAELSAILPRILTWFESVGISPR